MAVVALRGPLKQRAGGEAEHRASGATVGEALQDLERAQPALAGWVLDERGAVRRHINVFVNGELRDAETAIDDGDRLDVLPAISGG